MNDQLRRRSVGAPAARSMLLTILGEYVMPRHDALWQETLIDALGTLGYKPQAARQALARSVTAGWLRAERVGRRSRVELTAETSAMLETGARRIYAFGSPWEWDGRWLVVVLRVPEERRDVRHQARTQLAWAGFGSLGGGLWISPHAEREEELRSLSGEGSAAELLSLRAEFGSLGDPRKIVEEAWDLDAVSAAYTHVHRRLRAAVRPRTPEAVVRRPDDARARVAQVPVPGPGSPRGDAPGRLAARAAHTISSPSVTTHGARPRADYFGSLEAERRAA